MIFNIQYRGMLNEKITWKDIENVFNNYEPKENPTIDIVYKRMIERG